MKKKKKRFNWRRKNCYISKFLGIGKNEKKKNLMKKGLLHSENLKTSNYLYNNLFILQYIISK